MSHHGERRVLVPVQLHDQVEDMAGVVLVERASWLALSLRLRPASLGVRTPSVRHRTDAAHEGH